ncbi:protoheme IX farnesyltransferase [Barrientosiimonas humi]|uniref:Protoheme IX farnesyltransferase n=1 Tax=Barrientosiimonas humi TaxID=999931 RepID=A0A542XBQ2_9MICO|nr:heme o synthase [Barrientosiimonas humi]TQL33269.1 protoheme IX farnesyltransferase [Barrientosiimonas humi]CAG7573258.1 Protoheme IX farnesyltransferase [Barrientosiimonas humi]
MTATEPRPIPAAGTSHASPGAPQRSARQVVADYVSLTKPRIIELLLVTTFPVMFLAERGVPSLWLILATLIGGSLSAGSANTLNCYLDRDIDRLMHRTEGRPLVTGAITPRAALTFGLVLGVASVLWLGLLVNWLSAMLSLGAIALYVGFYTMLLKRRTSQNIVWGGVAGCMPVLIGWSAVTNSLSWAAVVLFLVVFFWTPPHYWPLSMRFRDDYAAAGVPMLPVVAERQQVARQVVLYAWATVLTSLALIPVGGMGWVYTVVAVVSGGVFLLESHRLQRAAGHPEGAGMRPMRLFHFSISYLTLVFLGVAIDPLWHLPLG